MWIELRVYYGLIVYGLKKIRNVGFSWPGNDLSTVTEMALAGMLKTVLVSIAALVVAFGAVAEPASVRMRS